VSGAPGSAEVQQPGTNLYWLRCPVGQTWTGSACSGVAKVMNWHAAKGACPSGYRLPTRQEFIDLLGGCDGKVMRGKTGYCTKCSESGTCNSMFPSQLNTYWSSSLFNGDQAWIASFYNGYVPFFDVDGVGVFGVKSDAVTRCVRSGP
jgi:hypothetical protein